MVAEIVAQQRTVDKLLSGDYPQVKNFSEKDAVSQT
jgi:hypothetical protein